MNLNELCLPDGRIFSPYLACMLKGVLHDAIEKAMDEVDGELISVVKYNEIDTSQIGQQEITYTLKDKAGNETKQTMVVDVVKYFKNKIFSPTQVQPEIVKNPEDITVLVNKVHQLPQD